MSEQQQYGTHGVNGAGGDAQNLGGFLGGDKHGHNLISHLLGLDHDAHFTAPHHSASSVSVQGHALQGPSGSSSWAKALRSVKLSDLFQGLKLTPNMLFMMLYASFVAWLFVIYWVRHHEPLANSVLGTANPGSASATAAADRRIIAGTKLAFPARTSSETGDIYVPNFASQIAATDNSQYAATQLSVPLPAPPVPPVPAPEPQPIPLSGKQAGELPAKGPYAAAFGQPQVMMVSEPEATGVRLKMIVNR